MQKNMSNVDRVVRFIVAVVVALLYATGVLSGWAAIVLGIIALVLLVTAVVGVCPLYALLGITTKR